ncbi:hypothetical protein Y032_0008g1 [Ancylostoma ceylanicum]|uniref:Uncharacterized protein n=1 Tax=Ancylostoma ceylanicum TaxID=53326 RepID=A0A016VLL4_9BILA|nr:hypothetical protein Y032_0008g1 [Ancylostoma ceylanicum]
MVVPQLSFQSVAGADLSLQVGPGVFDPLRMHSCDRIHEVYEVVDSFVYVAAVREAAVTSPHFGADDTSRYHMPLDDGIEICSAVIIRDLHENFVFVPSWIPPTSQSLLTMRPTLFLRTMCVSSTCTTVLGPSIRVKFVV